ncbi:MAG: glycosyltransferase family 39 protein [Candidatus Hadarchaeum sp.]
MLRDRQSPGAGRLQEFAFPALVLLIAGLLLFCRLDDIYLWQDEAETAVISRNLLSFGLPLATDGKNLVQQTDEASVSFRANYVWIFHSWLQFALTALAFAALGPTTLAARLPFVLVGLATYGFFYSFVSRWLEDRRTAQVASILLLFCVPFILHVRQCRYYVLTAFMTLLILDAYLRLRKEEPWAVPYFVFSALLFYHSHYGAFFPTLAALFLHFFLSKAERRLLYRFFFSLFLIVVLVLPWACFMRVWNRGQLFLLDRFLAHLAQYTIFLTVWIFPVILVPVLLVAWLRRSRRNGFALNPAQAAFCELASLILLVNVLFLSASAAFDWAFFRYILHLVPLLLILLAIIVVLVMERWIIVGTALLVTLVVSNALHILPYSWSGIKHINWQRVWPGSDAFGALQRLWIVANHFRSDLLMYTQQLTHSYEGPIEGLVHYLSEHAKPWETVIVNDEDLPLMFYTDLRVFGGLTWRVPSGEMQPDWVIDRKHGYYRDLLAEIISSGPYERIVLPYPDIRWENREQPGAHHYLTVRGEDNVVLYRRRED